MSTVDIVRAWKDPEYRQNLSDEEQARLPGHPAGSIELVDEELDQVAGGSIVTGTYCLTLSFLGLCTLR